MQMLDVIIVGGGPIGIACGLEAQKKGLSYLIIEKGPIVNSLFNYPTNMQFFSSSEKLEIDNIPFISIEAKPKRDEALEYYRRIVTTNELNINLFEKVENITKLEGSFTITSSKATYSASNIVIATGFYDLPKTLNVPGEDLPKVSHYYDNPHFYAKQKVAVIGASNSAIDAALECYRKGSEVTLIIRGSEVGHRVKYWVRPDIINRIEEESIKVFYNTTVKKIKKNELILNTPEGEATIENDFTLALTGYQPNFEFLKNLGVTLSNNEKKSPETHKWFIENSRIHAKLIMSNLLINKGN